MSSYSWLTSLTCTNPVIQSTDTFMTVLEWVRFIFLSPCPQRVLFSAVDALFLFTLLVLVSYKICLRFSSNDDPNSLIHKPLLEEGRPGFRTTLWFRLTLLVTSLLAIASTVFCLLALSQGTQTSWEVKEAIFRLIQAITQVGILILLVHEKKFNVEAHPLSLRIYWMENFVLVCAFAVSSISRLLFANDSIVDSTLRLDDIIYLCELPLSVFLLVVATRGSTGINEVSEFGSNLDEKALEPNVSMYATASFFSKLVWNWINPIINKGYKSPLNLEDVPLLPGSFRAETMSELFASKWPSPAEKSGHPVQTTLIRCFWKELVYTGFLCVIRLAVMYAGPVLVDSFVAFTSGEGSSPYEGYLLVLVLLIAKSIEVLSSHHFNFETMQLGMLIRSSLTSTLFKKGVRLSCSSRQAHGAGQIVNYMAVDVQQLGDTIQYLHSIWLMPMQIGVALLLLYGNLGIASLVALVGVIVVLLFIVWRTRENNRYQFQVMINRDSRIKATMEMINNMRVIKLQAWEDFFGERVKSYRAIEFGWVGKFFYCMVLNLVVLWNTPVVLAVLVFAVAIATGIHLDAGTVFTATTTFKILTEPVRNFPQSLTQISQAMIALERLDKYLRARELDQASVDRDEGCNSDIAVEVRDGSFSWDDEATEEVLSHLNLEIKKGEFAAIVGTVGSGKSSLLSTILGEMHKISGKVRVCGSTAYVAQSAWIQNSTIEENILLGLPMNRERYMETIRVCSLEKDLGIMEFGDQTEIGERGINLSGGQKQRIQLARAVYQDCDIYLLDDVFSAVDAQTASDLFKECLRSTLRDKTVLLVTHQVDFLHNADLILVEAYNNMRVIKLQAWENFFGERVKSYRAIEFGWVGKFLYCTALNLVVLWNTPVVLAVLVFAVAIVTGIHLDAGTVFTATTTFKILSEPVRNFPQSLTQISQAMISLERLDKYLRARELDQASVDRDEGCNSDIAVEVRDGSFSWDDKATEKVLSDLNLEIKKGEFAAIVGTVGSGKSSLLSSILGEMHKISGKFRVCGSTAYVAQSAWIQNSTIEENILFGLPMNRERYMETIRVCSLGKDLGIMEFGDQTEIGERGINLSGGQKQRIQLARAVYQDCDIYLLDDVFSAVDAQTASDLFKECLRSTLRDKTVLLVSHQVDFLHNADLILVMREGKIVQSGKYEDLLGAGLDFGALVAAHETSMEIVGMGNFTSGNKSSEGPKSNKLPIQMEANGHEKSVVESKSDKGTSKLIEDEEREEGRVSSNVYKKYFTKSYGWWGVISFAIISLLWQLSLMASDFWLAYETSADREFVPNMFIGVYAILAAISMIIVAIRAFYLTFLGLKTSQSFFDQMLNSILRAPMSFFDTTPSGRILSRASTDQVNIDILIPIFLGMVLVMYFSVIGIIFITCVYSWPTTFLVIPLIWVNIWYRGYFIAASRELTRLDSITKAPIIHHFSETVSGITTIRSFKRQWSFIQENISKIDENLRMVFYNNGANEWLGFRLEFIGCCFLCLSTMFMVMLPSSIIKPEYVGMSLSYGLSLNVVLFYSIFMTCLVENRMVSVERIEQYINIPSEAQWKIPGCLPTPNWPTHGNIEIKDLKVRYRSNTPLVLKGMTLSINSGEKIGIVGRTGSGKSTLIQVFFRLVEPSGGKIIVDEVDIFKLGLHDLRSRFGIIPQEPVLFQGTVRSNIDPIGLYSDEEIWKALECCRLKDVVAAKPDKLDSSVADSGENWSMGQRQLLCLGRVLLKQTRILFLDEATASVDSQTDAIIQKIIREDFSSCTIISIAHRIPTIMDCDRVLVVDDGRAKEFDKPSHLLKRPSIFAALVQEYANRSSE